MDKRGHKIDFWDFSPKFTNFTKLYLLTKLKEEVENVSEDEVPEPSFYRQCSKSFGESFKKPTNITTEKTIPFNYIPDKTVIQSTAQRGTCI